MQTILAKISTLTNSELHELRDNITCSNAPIIDKASVISKIDERLNPIRLESALVVMSELRTGET